MSIFGRLFGDPNQREVNRYQLLVEQVAKLEPELEQQSLDELKATAIKLRQEIEPVAAQIISETEAVIDPKIRQERRKHELTELLKRYQALAFALVREVSKRTIGLRHFDVQMIGGAVLHEGKIAEMQTGEGKTLVASLPLFLNALTGLGVHLVTVNDYLARRDAGWMAPIYHSLGLSLGVIGPQFSYQYDPEFSNDETDPRLQHFKVVSRAEAYRADITYGTNNELGFDYLRDNMAVSTNQLSQRELAFAIVDEVDSILIDEARTPLIISTYSHEAAELYQKFAAFIPKLKSDDYSLDEKARAVSLKDSGIKKLEQLSGVANLYDPANVSLVHHADTALKAAVLYKKNRDYVVKDGEIVIVDEFTGRMLQGRRYSSGLHQAIEAKEGVAVKEESVTLATITFQNYFRLYFKLAGMTGTATTEAEEFSKIYHLEVVSIPTNRPSTRQDLPDVIYKTEAAKFNAIAEKVRDLQQQGQPVLIGTVSIAKSEKLSRLLKAKGVTHNVLNAKAHQKEGEIVARAGETGAVTVATNMAGRGVDIILGGQPPESTDKNDRRDILGGAPPKPEAAKAEFEKWEVEHQKVLSLKGLFVIGTERHESRRIDNQLRGRAGRQGDPGVSQFYLSTEDDLMRIFGGDRMKNLMERLRVPDDVSINNPLLSRAVEQAQSRVEGHNFDIRKQLVEYDDVTNKQREAIYRRRQLILKTEDLSSAAALHDQILMPMTDDERASYLVKYQAWSPEVAAQVERAVCLRAIDVLWIEHLKNLEDLRESIGLRGYGQREPIVEYKQEAYRLFNSLNQAIDEQISNMLIHVETEVKAPEPIPTPTQIMTNNDQAANLPAPSADQKVGRNDPCPCGATHPDGRPKKYKHCHGR